ncbi:MAG: PTS sugar transporter subunit IIA [Myxococcota bacterium]
MGRRDGAPPDTGRGRSVETSLRMDARSRAEVLGGIGRAARARCPRVDAGAVTRALEQREDREATHVAPGVTMPHADVEGLDEPTLVDVTLAEPVRWGASGEAVARCLVLLVPPGERGAHLELAAAAARRLRGL